MIALHTPEFWTQKNSLVATALSPLGMLYYRVATLCAKRQTPFKADVPVICVGNVVIGGAGKTPVAMAIAKKLQARGKKIYFLSKGYGGQLKGPLQVDTTLHTAQEVGDEPLLLAEEAPTIVARDRVLGARYAYERGAEIIIMDDGFQNHTIHKDIALLVIDGRYGIGNGKLLPAGPLREPLDTACARAQGIVIVNESKDHPLRAALQHNLPVLTATTFAFARGGIGIGKKVLGFSGIARPEKFYNSLQQLQCEIVMMRSFPDHYPFTAEDIITLRNLAKAQDAMLVTTTKDFVRIPAHLREDISVITIETLFDDDALLCSVLQI